MFEAIWVCIAKISFIPIYAHVVKRFDGYKITILFSRDLQIRQNSNLNEFIIHVIKYLIFFLAYCTFSSALVEISV